MMNENFSEHCSALANAYKTSLYTRKICENDCDLV